MFLNVDLKILAKVLAGRLNSVNTALIQPDQSRFIQCRGTDINIRRLLTHMDRAEKDSLGVVVSLDAEKAFELVEWEFLLAVLRKFSLGKSTRQGLFVLAVEPLASQIQVEPVVRGIQVGVVEEIRVNWDKSLIYPLKSSRPHPPMQSPLEWVDSFKYLGIHMGGSNARYMDRNLTPLLGTFLRRCTDWKLLLGW